MRMTALGVLGALCFAVSTVSANAAPLAPAPASPEASNIVQVAGGCGRGLHRNYRGHCVRNHRPYAYYRYHRRPYYRPYAYYGGGYEPWNRPSPSDYVANRLNAQQLYRGPWGY